MSEGPDRVVGLPFAGGIIVDTTGGKWGLVEMPDGRRVVHDVSSVVAVVTAEAVTAPSTRRRLLGLATHGELADDAGVEAFTQMILERLMEAHDEYQRRHHDSAPEDPAP